MLFAAEYLQTAKVVSLVLIDVNLISDHVVGVRGDNGSGGYENSDAHLDIEVD